MCETENIITPELEPEVPEAPEGLTREEKWRLELEEAERQHRILVAENVEKAKDPAQYETYTATTAAFDSNIRVFSARRRGRSHIASGLPCQDYCLTAEFAHGMILTDADGVGSCERSDIGSRMACEVTVDLIQALGEKYPDEETFVEVLTGLPFREALVRRWLGQVLRHGKEHPVPAEMERKPHECYGSTLLFAVITEHYYIAGNLGDGQILLFNGEESVKLRFHKPKESPRTRALVHANCPREDFQIAKYLRRDFDGILLSTDGMYDVLCNGNILFQYARQLKGRFLEAGAPLQPFCFEEQGEPMRDLFSHRTKDDCSIVLALDLNPVQARKRISGLGVDADAVTLESVADGRACYRVDQEGQTVHVIATPEGTALPELPEEAGWHLVHPLLCWTRDGIHYGVYPHKEALTLNQMHHTGAFREQRETSCNASAFVLGMYRKVMDCHRMLEQQGLRFAPGAYTLIRVDEGENLILYPEALEPVAENAGMGLEQIQRLFDNLAGVLTCGAQARPIFHLGFRRSGQALNDLDRVEEPMCRVRNAGPGKLELVNLEQEPWYLEGNGVIEPGGALLLEHGTTFYRNGEIRCEFTGRESM